MKATHEHIFSGTPYHWDGDKWWFLPESNGSWKLSKHVVPEMLKPLTGE